MNQLPDTTIPHFSLPNFEGPLELLLYLVAQEEIDVSEISIRSICDQFLLLLEEELATDISTAADLLPTTALLLCIKSKALLPASDQSSDDLQAHLDPRWSTLKNMIDYHGFKQVARWFSQKEIDQQQVYTRNLSCQDLPVLHHSQLEPVPVLKLAEALQRLLTAPPPPKRRTIYQEAWLVADAIVFLRDQLFFDMPLPFEKLFLPEHCRAQWIVTFLGILELMKMGEVAATIQEDSSITISRKKTTETLELTHA